MWRKQSAAAFVATLAATTVLTAAGSADGTQVRTVLQVKLGKTIIDHFHSNAISVSGITAHSIDVRLLGATDMAGRAYEWTPYRWQRLRHRRGWWRGVLPAPVMFGTYQLQLRLDHGRKLLSSTRWLERVFPHGTETRNSFATPSAVIHNYVARLPGDEILVAVKRWPLPAYDHRDPRLNRLFVIAYARRGIGASSRFGEFITTVRDRFHGRWRLLQATTEPPD